MNIPSTPSSLSDDDPSGENLEYDPVYIELELAAQPGEERQIGDDVIEAEEPDYAEISELAQKVLERSHDLRAAVLLAHAELRRNGIPEFAEAVSFIKGCVDDFWETCHPQLDADDDNDPTMRVNAILNLADSQGILSALRLAPLTQSRGFGRFSLRDIAIADGEATPPAGMDTPPDAASIAAAFQDTNQDVLRAILASARQAAEHVESIGARFDEMAPGQGPDLSELVKMLKHAAKRVSDAVADDSEDAALDDDEGGSGAVAEAPAARAEGGGSGAVNGPNDVLAAIDRIMAYYARSEPSSPVPILMARAKKLVNADFLTIVKDLAPSGVESVTLIGGLNDE